MKRNIDYVLFLITFGITIFSRILSIHKWNFLPYTSIYVAFIFFWLFYLFVSFIKDGSYFTMFSKKGSLVCVMLLLYFTFTAFSNIRNLDSSDVLTNYIREILMVLFYFVCILSIDKFRCLDKCVTITYFLLVSFLLVVFVANLSSLNLSKTIHSFWIGDETLRYRVNFGFIHNNIAAEFSLATILLSVVFLIRKTNRLKILLILLDLIMFVIIIANNSRGSFIALLFMAIVFLYLFTVHKKDSLRLIIKKIPVMLIVILIVILFYYMGNSFDFNSFLVISNRNHTFSNIELLSISGRWLFGIGGLSGGFFTGKNFIYGFQTTYLEISYVRFLVTSGVFGSLWICFILLILFRVFKFDNNTISKGYSKWVFSLLLYICFISLFEEYMFSYGYITSTLFTMIILSYANNVSYNPKKSVSKRLLVYAKY